MLNIYAIFMDLIGVIYGFLCGLSDLNLPA